nr:hypothetical protein [uncultured Bdellovibrio sp.]
MKRQGQRTFNPLRNSRGFLTAEFIFSIVLAAGMCIVLFSLKYTLSIAEVAQYIAFSTARAHAAAHVDQDKQEQLAKDKYKELLNNPVLKPLFNNPDGGWFKLSAEPEIRGGGQKGNSFEDYGSSSTPDRVPQVGVRFDFQPRILNLKVPFLGATTEDPDAGFSARISGLLIREPTATECMDLQVRRRYDAIIQLDSRYGILGASGKNKYVPLEDNGC